MIDMTGIMPAGAPFRRYRVDAQVVTFLERRGMPSARIAELLHDIGCGQLEALTRLGEILRSRRQPTILGRGNDIVGGGTLICDVPLGPAATWSSGVGCAFLKVDGVPETLAGRLPGMTADEVVAHGELEPGRRIISVTDHEDGRRSLVLEARTVHAKPLRRTVRRGSHERQAKAQEEAFGTRPAKDGFEPRVPALGVDADAIPLLAAYGLGWAALSTLAGRLLMGEWTVFPALGSATGMLILAGYGALAARRMRRCIRRGGMPDRIGEVTRRLAEARAAAGVADD